MSEKLILLADDSSTMHRAVKLALSRADSEILCVDNGTDALRICREKRPALLIADLDLPGVSGAELIKLVKGDPQMTETKVILLCASIHQSDMNRLDRITADARLWKPFESEALFTIVQALMKKSGASSRTSTTLSSAQTQQMQRPVIDAEATRPMKASTLVDRTMPPVEQPPAVLRESTQSREATAQIKREATVLREQTAQTNREATAPIAPIGNREATQNLWTSDFDLPPATGSKSDRTNTESLSAYREAQDEWEVLESKQKVPTPPPPPKEATKSGLMTKSPVGERTGPVSAAPSSAPTRDDIRNMIRAEIQLAFDTWFREKLEAKLQDILSQIESESKK